MQTGVVVFAAGAGTTATTKASQYAASILCVLCKFRVTCAPLRLPPRALLVLGGSFILACVWLGILDVLEIHTITVRS